MRTSASIELAKRKIERLAEEFNALAETDSSLSPAKRNSVGIVIAMRPYVLSHFTRFKRRQRALDEATVLPVKSARPRT